MHDYAVDMLVATGDEVSRKRRRLTSSTQGCDPSLGCGRHTGWPSGCGPRCSRQPFVALRPSWRSHRWRSGPDRRLMTDKVRLRREAKMTSIVAAAWQLAREHGIGGVSLHALAREAGMRHRRSMSTSTRSMRSTTRCSPTGTGSCSGGSRR